MSSAAQTRGESTTQSKGPSKRLESLTKDEFRRLIENMGMQRHSRDLEPLTGHVLLTIQLSTLKTLGLPTLQAKTFLRRMEIYRTTGIPVSLIQPAG